MRKTLQNKQASATSQLTSYHERTKKKISVAQRLAIIRRNQNAREEIARLGDQQGKMQFNLQASFRAVTREFLKNLNCDFL